RRRSADHDGDRPRHRGAGRARLQLAGPPQQGGDAEGTQFLLRSPRGAAQERQGRARHGRRPDRQRRADRLTMGMNVGSAEDDDEDGVVAAINTTPLVDVMLVLLIIFLITVPVVIHTVPVSLPKEVNPPTRTRPENINLAV